MPLRSGFVSILGRPNAGKSTLTNALVGEKVSIVTRKPQTTRSRIQGVVEVSGIKGKRPAAQIVLIDTPGVHKPANQLDRRMLQEIYDALESRDAVIHVVDVTRRPRRTDLPESPVILSKAKDLALNRQTADLSTSSAEADFARDDKVFVGNDKFAKRNLLEDEEAFILDLLKKVDCPVFLVLNKIDAVGKKDLLPLIARFSALYPYAEVLPVSARTGAGLDDLLGALARALPEGPRYFQKGEFTDQPERFLAAEIIREKILNFTGEEVPYASAVVIERYEEAPEATGGRGKQKPLTRIAAAIYCERPGQKAILIGKGGAMLKQIGTAARKELEFRLNTRVHLELFVKIASDWRGSRSFVDSLDWRRQLEELAKRQGNEGEDDS
jgi:GTP-binding protein Era